MGRGTRSESVAAQWVCGEIDTAEANYWILGGHSDRGVDSRGIPRGIWNAHDTMFDAASLRALVSRCGFTDLNIVTYDLRCLALRAPVSGDAGLGSHRHSQVQHHGP